MQGSVNQLNATSGILGDLSLADVLPSPEAITAAIETVHRYLKAETARAKSEAERYPQTVRVEFEFMALAELEKEIEKMNLEELRKDKYNCELLLHCMHAMRNQIEEGNNVDAYILFLHFVTRIDMITAKEKQLKENEQKKKRKREEEIENAKKRKKKIKYVPSPEEIYVIAWRNKVEIQKIRTENVLDDKHNIEFQKKEEEWYNNEMKCRYSISCKYNRQYSDINKANTAAVIKFDTLKKSDDLY